MSWYQWQGEDLLLTIHLQPGARDDAIVGLHGERLKIRISAAATDDRANRRLCHFLGQCFDVPSSRVHLERGAKSRAKHLRIIRPQQLIDGIQRPL